MEPSNEAPKKSKCRRRKCFLIPLMVVAAVLLKGLFVYFLWNWLIPDLFHLPVIDYLQAVGLVVLCKVLFGCGFRPRHGHRWGKCEGLSPEDRLELRDEIRNRCD